MAQEFPRASVTHGPRSRRERLTRNLAQRVRPSRRPHLNATQRIIWRAQRLVLGNTASRRDRRAARRRGESF